MQWPRAVVFCEPEGDGGCRSLPARTLRERVPNLLRSAAKYIETIDGMGDRAQRLFEFIETLERCAPITDTWDPHTWTFIVPQLPEPFQSSFNTLVDDLCVSGRPIHECNWMAGETWIYHNTLNLIDWQTLRHDPFRRAKLDALAAERPAILNRLSRHVSALTSAALGYVPSVRRMPSVDPHPLIALDNDPIAVATAPAPSATLPFMPPPHIGTHVAADGIGAPVPLERSTGDGCPSTLAAAPTLGDPPSPPFQQQPHTSAHQLAAAATQAAATTSATSTTPPHTTHAHTTHGPDPEVGTCVPFVTNFPLSPSVALPPPFASPRPEGIHPQVSYAAAIDALAASGSQTASGSLAASGGAVATSGAAAATDGHSPVLASQPLSEATAPRAYSSSPAAPAPGGGAVAAASSQPLSPLTPPLATSSGTLLSQAWFPSPPCGTPATSPPRTGGVPSDAALRAQMQAFGAPHPTTPLGGAAAAAASASALQAAESAPLWSAAAGVPAATLWHVGGAPLSAALCNALTASLLGNLCDLSMWADGNHPPTATLVDDDSTALVRALVMRIGAARRRLMAATPTSVGVGQQWTPSGAQRPVQWPQQQHTFAGGAAPAVPGGMVPVSGDAHAIDPHFAAAYGTAGKFVSFAAMYVPHHTLSASLAAPALLRAETFLAPVYVPVVSSGVRAPQLGFGSWSATAQPLPPGGLRTPTAGMPVGRFPVGGAAPPPRRGASEVDPVVHIVQDNAAAELAADLLLAETLLAFGIRRVVLHIKARPHFISDTTVPDVVDLEAALGVTGRWLRRSGVDRRVYTNVWGSVDAAGLEAVAHDGAAGRPAVYVDPPVGLSFRPDTFWCDPCEMRHMPPHIRGLFNGRRGDLVILKGDLNYRRLLGDRYWRTHLPFNGVIAGSYPAGVTVACLRVTKCQLGVGIDPIVSDTLGATDPQWLSRGAYAVVQIGVGARVD